jgi:hypothetical protein
MKTINKVFAAMMMMAITTTMPAMAGNKHHNDRNDKKITVVVVNNDRGGSHFDKVDRALSYNYAHKGNAYRPDVKTCTFKVSRHENYKKVVAKAENMKGVIDAKWNPRTHEVTVRYDAKVTSVRNIKHFMA